MPKVKCECINCGHVQWLDDGCIEDCVQCGFYINADEDVCESQPNGCE